MTTTNSESLQRDYLTIAQQLDIPGHPEFSSDTRPFIQRYLSQNFILPWIVVFNNTESTELWISKSNIQQETGNSGRSPTMNAQGLIHFTTRDGKTEIRYSVHNVLKATAPSTPNVIVRQATADSIASQRLHNDQRQDYPSPQLSQGSGRESYIEDSPVRYTPRASLTTTLSSQASANQIEDEREVLIAYTESQVIPGHKDDAVQIVLFSPNSRFLVIVSTKSLKLWDLQRKFSLKLSDHKKRVVAVAFSPNSTLLASASQDKTVILWDTRSGQKIIKPLKEHKDAVMAVAFSADGTILASASNDKTMKLWRIPSGDLIGTLDGHGEEIIAVAFSQNGQLLASASKSMVKLWNTTQRAELWTVRDPEANLNAVVFSKDGKQLLTRSGLYTTARWDVITETLTHTSTGNDVWASAMAFTSGDKVLASEYDNQAATTNKWVTHLKAARQVESRLTACGPAFSIDYKLVAYGLTNGSARLWEMRSTVSPRSLSLLAGRLKDLN
jgi:WD40 repeat protein